MKEHPRKPPCNEYNFHKFPLTALSCNQMTLRNAAEREAQGQNGRHVNARVRRRRRWIWGAFGTGSGTFRYSTSAVHF